MAKHEAQGQSTSQKNDNGKQQKGEPGKHRKAPTLPKGVIGLKLGTRKVNNNDYSRDS